MCRSILPHAPYAGPHVQLRVLAVVVRVSNRHARVRLDRVLHALFHAPLLIRDAVRFFHANQEGKRGLVAFFCLVGLICNSSLLFARVREKKEGQGT